MHRLTAWSGLLLAACTTAAPQVTGFRNPATPLYSSAVLLADQITGTWTEVADFASEPGSCRPSAISIIPGPVGLQVTGTLCLAGAPQVLSGPLTAVGPGRFAVTGVAEPWWVLWADADRRTLVIGTPSGRFGFVLNRGGVLPADRSLAVREVLDFNGYDLDRLQSLP